MKKTSNIVLIVSIILFIHYVLHAGVGETIIDFIFKGN